MGFLAGKKILITGLLSKHSIAYGIAKACHREGAQLAFTYQNERFEDRIKKFAAEFGSDITIPLDVAATSRSTMPSSNSASAGTAWTASFTPSPTRRPKPSRATSSTASRATPSASPTRFRPTATRRWPRPPGR
jgi:hypothetical protein